MLLSLSSDQEFFRETTGRFLADRVPVAELRRLREDPQGFSDDYWRQGAELGWTSLLVDDASGGGSISDDGVIDLSLIAHQFGAQAAPGPLVPTNVVAAALSDRAPDVQAEVLAGLLAGTTIATWCYAEPKPGDRLGDIAFDIRLEGSEVVLNGTKRPVESGARADHFLVTGRTGAGPDSTSLTQVLVAADTPGITVEAMDTVDLTRRFSVVRFDDVRVPADAVVGQVGEAADQVERQLQLALVMIDAESVGAMQTAFDTTVEWAFDRYSFGRPLASYQALKHRFADMKTWLEASHATSDAVGRGGGRRRARRRRAGRARPRPTSATTAASSCRTACRSTAASA